MNLDGFLVDFKRDFEGILRFFFKEWVVYVIHEERFLQSFKVVVDGFFQLVVSLSSKPTFSYL